MIWAPAYSTLTFQDDKKNGIQGPVTSFSCLKIFADDIKAYNEQHPDAKMVYNYIPVKQTPWWVSMIPSLLLLGALVFFYVMMMRQARGGGTGGMMSFGKAKPRMPEENTHITFADVAGADEEKEELVEIVDFLKAPSKFNTLGARIPKGRYC